LPAVEAIPDGQRKVRFASSNAGEYGGHAQLAGGVEAIAAGEVRSTTQSSRPDFAAG
jgi:hypothetical protein